MFWAKILHDFEVKKVLTALPEHSWNDGSGIIMERGQYWYVPYLEGVATHLRPVQQFRLVFSNSSLVQDTQRVQVPNT